MKVSRAVVSVLCTMVLFFGQPLVTGAVATWEVVVSGLDNPRGLEFGPDGALYIAQAGRGGEGPCGPGPQGTRCYGDTGAITRYDLRDGSVTDVVTGLPSLALQEGQLFATGPNDLSMQGRGNLFFTLGFGGDPAERALFGPGGSNLASLGRATPNGAWRTVTDLGQFEAERNPAGGPIDTNPYGVLALPGKQVVVDAGGNALIEVRANGKRSTLAVFPSRLVPAPPFLGLPAGAMIPMDAVPTSVAVGPDGDYYVGQLTGFPFPVGGANVYRVPARGGDPVIVASGFTNIVDLAFGPDGSLYVLEIARNGLLAAFGRNDWTGALIRIAPDGTRTELVPGVLTAPGGLAVGSDGSVYVTNNSIYSGIGEVVRIQP